MTVRKEWNRTASPAAEKHPHSLMLHHCASSYGCVVQDDEWSEYNIQHSDQAQSWFQQTIGFCLLRLESNLCHFGKLQVRVASVYPYYLMDRVLLRWFLFFTLLLWGWGGYKIHSDSAVMTPHPSGSPLNLQTYIITSFLCACLHVCVHGIKWRLMRAFLCSKGNLATKCSEVMRCVGGCGWKGSMRASSQCVDFSWQGVYKILHFLILHFGDEFSPV